MVGNEFREGNDQVPDSVAAHNKVYRNHGGGVFVTVTSAGDLENNAFRSRALSWADYDGESQRWHVVRGGTW